MISPIALPDELDNAFYRDSNRDLRGFDPSALKVHYQQFGRHEGRAASPAALRENFVELIPKSAPVLEIGPFFRPTVRGDHMRYFDVLTTAELTQRAREIKQETSFIPEIHYVSAIGDLSIVPDRFPAAVSSHCIEHQPNLIKHLSNIAALLTDGGYYFLIIPDKRYCFDHFIAESTIADVIDAHLENRSVHRLRSVIEHRALTTHNDPARHWRADHMDPAYAATVASRTQAAIQEFTAAKGGYVDVHAWQFSPESFRNITGLLCDLGYSTMRPVRVYSTPYGRDEFTAILQKAGG